MGLFLTPFLKSGSIITDLSPVETDDFSKVSVVSRLRILEGYREEFKVIFGYIYQIGGQCRATQELMNTVTKFKGMAFLTTRMTKAGLSGVKKQSLPVRRLNQRRFLWMTYRDKSTN